LATRVSTDRPTVGRLVDAAPGVALRVVRLDGDAADAVGAEGLLPGVVVSIERRIAFGGPLIVRLGRARLALSREVARQIVVEPAAESPAAPR
jgi:Fe2+ transport system protein FeoA